MRLHLATLGSGRTQEGEQVRWHTGRTGADELE